MDSNDKYLQTIADYKKVFETEHGQRVLIDLMRASNYIGNGFAPDPYQTAFNCGNKAMMTRIINLLEMDEFKLREIIKEQRKAENDGRQHFNVGG